MIWKLFLYRCMDLNFTENCFGCQCHWSCFHQLLISEMLACHHTFGSQSEGAMQDSWAIQMSCAHMQVTLGEERSCDRQALFLESSKFSLTLYAQNCRCRKGLRDSRVPNRPTRKIATRANSMELKAISLYMALSLSFWHSQISWTGSLH